MMPVTDNRSIIRRYYQELWNEWNLKVADEIIAPNIRFRGSLSIEVGGIEGFKSYVRTVQAAFPDFLNTIDDLIGEGHKIVARLIYSGTHKGELFGVPATQRRVTYSGIAIFRLEGGRIAEGWVVGDTLDLLQQILGAHFWKNAQRSSL